MDEGDSDGFPQYAPEEETDSPDHCASVAECLEGIDLGEYGLPDGAPLYGAEVRRIGAVTNAGLTEYGREYLAEMLAERDPTPYQRALHRLWRDLYEVPEPDAARTVLLHLNVEVPADDDRPVSEIVAAVLGAIEVGSDDESVSGLVVECPLAEVV